MEILLSNIGTLVSLLIGGLALLKTFNTDVTEKVIADDKFVNRVRELAQGITNSHGVTCKMGTYQDEIITQREINKSFREQLASVKESVDRLHDSIQDMPKELRLVMKEVLTETTKPAPARRVKK